MGSVASWPTASHTSHALLVAWVPTDRQCLETNESAEFELSHKFGLWIQWWHVSICDFLKSFQWCSKHF